MRQLQLIAHGEPSDVVELNTVSEPALGHEDVLISMEAAPINPSDFLFVRGMYGVRAVFPSSVGAEGVGRVAKIGSKVDPALRGKRVLILPTYEQGDVEGPVVEFLGDRAESGKLRDPGIGEHNIEFALFLLDLRKQTIKVAKIRNVSLYAGYISADLLYRRSQLRLASARYEDVRAFVDKRFCRSESNTASPASNECGFSFKLVHIFPSSFYQSCQIVGTTCRRAPQPGFVCC